MQMDGLIEQFHQTLKKIIYKFVPDDAYKCDKWLRPLLFPVREILQATMRFSPLELPWGQRPHSVLDIMWENFEAEPSQIVNETQYDLDLKAKLHTFGN